MLAHCAGTAQAPDAQSRSAAVAKMQPLVKTVSSYADTLSVAGSGQNPGAAMQAASTLGSALVPGSQMPVERVLRAVKTARGALQLPSASVGDFLNSRVFVAANVEGMSSDTTTYLLHGSTFCGDANAATAATDANAVDAADANATGSACAQTIDKLAVRCVVTTNGQNQNIAVQVGTSPDDVVTLTYNTASQAITVDGDLAQVQSVLATLGDRTQSKTQLTGHVSLALAKPSATQASATWGLPTAVSVTTQGGSGASNVAFAAAPTALRVSADNTNWLISAAIQAVDVSSPLVGQDGNSTTTLKAHLAGLTGQITGDASSQGSIAIQGFGLGNGPSTLTQNDQVLLQAELNADANHTVDVTVGEADPNGTQALTLSPALNVTVQAAMAPLSPQYDVPQELLSNTYSVALTNANKPVLLHVFSGDLLGVGNGSLQVTDGQMVLTSKQGNVTVPAGQCLTPKADAANRPSWVMERQASPCDWNSL